MPTLRLMLASGIVVFACLAPVPAQDWIPFHVAAELAPRGEWSAIYPSSSAQSLFDVPPAFRTLAQESVRNNGVVAFPEHSLTSFVSPPPAALLLAPLPDFHWRTSLTVWRLALAIPICAALLWLAAGLGDLSAKAHWSWLCLVGAPVVNYVVFCGQPSAYLLVAAALSVLPPTPSRDAVGGVALGLGVLFKATPVLVIAGLWLAGRRRLALIAAAFSAVVFVGTAPATGLEAWTRFAAVSTRLASVVITDWNNAAIDAALLRPFAGVDGVFHESTGPTFVISQCCRLLLLLVSLRVASRSTEAPARRAAAAWIGWMAATPILWMHYLILLVPLIGASPRRRSGVDLVLVGLPSAVFLATVAGWRSGAEGYLLCAAWLASAVWLLSNRSLATTWLSRS